MAKRRTSSRSQNSASAPASAAASTKSPTKSTDGRRVLSVKKAEQMKSPALKQSKRNSVRKCKTTRNNKRAKIDALKPKKPPTAFFYFLEDFRKEFQEKNPDIKSMRDIGKACGEKWKTMTYEEKVQYYDIATEKRAEFDRAMADYMKQKESRDFQEYEDELEF